jgi:hypothetical protein
MSIHWPCASCLFAVEKPHRPKDAKFAGEEAGRFATQASLTAIPAIRPNVGGVL